jgi:hypothetical protein
LPKLPSCATRKNRIAAEIRELEAALSQGLERHIGDDELPRDEIRVFSSLPRSYFHPAGTLDGRRLYGYNPHIRVPLVWS